MMLAWSAELAPSQLVLGLLGLHLSPFTTVSILARPSTLSARLYKEQSAGRETYEHRWTCSISTPRGVRSPRHHCITFCTCAFMASPSKANLFLPIILGPSGGGGGSRSEELRGCWGIEGTSFGHALPMALEPSEAYQGACVFSDGCSVAEA